MIRTKQEPYRQLLLELAARLKIDDSDIAAEALRQAERGNLSNVPIHLADIGTDTFEQEMSSSLMTNVRQIQSDVADALDRLEAGTFGRCEQCGRDISVGRLQAIPYTRYCRDCAETAEDDGEPGFQPTLL